jgi:hypothetical protein
MYPDGTPRTKHVTTNAIVEFDAEETTATCRSYYTVFQQVDDQPLQPIIVGRYHDRFELVDGAWRWAERDYSLVDLIGQQLGGRRPASYWSSTPWTFPSRGVPWYFVVDTYFGHADALDPAQLWQVRCVRGPADD